MTPQQCIRFCSPLKGIILADPEARLPSRLPEEHAPPAEPKLDNEASDQREQVQQVLGSMIAAVRQLDEWQRESLDELQQVAVELALAIASRIVHKKLEADEFAVEELVREVGARLGTGKPLTVRLHPDDLALLGRRLGANQPLLPDNADVQLIPDPTLGRGDCLAEAGGVGLLARPKLQLAELREQLLGSLTDAQTERRKAVQGDRNLRRFPDRRQTA